ncbi:KR domain-containing protein [Sinorhizobium medicae]|nr:KR domain-containing protein [Sinorhizobium medicae]
MNVSAHAPIAVIGLACRAPGAPDVESFWRLVREAVHAVRRFDRDDLLASGEPAERVDGPDFVPVAGLLDEAECFDEEFFGIAPREAALMDPQIRVGLECAQAAFDAAGRKPGPALGRVGVFVGASLSTYLLQVFRDCGNLVEQYGALRVLAANDKDHLAGQIAYRLDLRGPAIAVGAACATSLVAIDLACRRLAEGEIDLALAGGVAIHFPQARGYLHEPGGIYSREGRCRAFDAAADGVTPGAGAAMVLLKPLARALAERDVVHAVVLGSAVSGDGADKVGYTAPSENGQAAAISAAWRRAGVDPREAGLIEGHGTGTPLGDAVELAALRRALPGARCALGSLKSNFGHLDVAAGAASFIKVVKAVETGIVPPTLHVARPNPAIQGLEGDFTLPTVATAWPTRSRRVAGVSSFGIGGTNAHVVVAEPPTRPPVLPDGPAVLTLGAPDEAGLCRLAGRLGEALDGGAAQNLRDVAFTMVERGGSFLVRRARRVRDLGEARAWLAALAAGGGNDAAYLGEEPEARAAAAWLAGGEPGPLAEALAALGGRRVPLPAYPFARRLQQLPKRASEAAVPSVPVTPNARPRDVLPALLESSLSRRAATQPVRTIDRRTGLATALDRLCAALTFRVLVSLDAFDGAGHPQAPSAIRGRIGVDPRMAPFVDFLFGILAEDGISLRSPPPTPEDAIRAVCAIDPAFGVFAELLERCAARIPQALKCAESGAQELYSEEAAAVLQTALSRTPPHSDAPIAAGALADALAAMARERDRPLRVLEIGAGAGGLTATLIAALPQAGATLTVSDVSRLFVRHLAERIGARTGVIYRAFDITRDPEAQGVAEGSFDVVVALDALHATGDTAGALCTAQRLLAPGGAVVAIETIRPSRWSSLIWGLSAAWWAARVDASGPLHDLAGWRATIEQAGAGVTTALARPAVASGGSDTGVLVIVPKENAAEIVAGKTDLADWLYTPAWSPVRAPEPVAAATDARPLVLLTTEDGAAAAVQARLAARPGAVALRCLAGEAFERLADGAFRVRPDVADDLAAAFRAAGLAKRGPLRILHAWSLDGHLTPNAVRRRRYGFASLIALTQALAAVEIKAPLLVGVLTDGVCDLSGSERLDPLACLVDAPVQLVGREQLNLEAFRLDIDVAEGPAGLARATDTALTLMSGERPAPLLALRGGRLWREIYEPRRVAIPLAPQACLSAGSSLLVLGGLGGIGRALAEAFAAVPGVRIALAARRAPSAAPADTADLDELVARGALAPHAREGLARMLTAGATLSLHPVDIADQERLTDVVAQIEREAGPVRGVIHAAGEPDFGGVMVRRSAAATDAALRAKVEGVAAIRHALGDRPVDLFVFCASIGSLLPNLKFGEVGYLAANAHLVAAARLLARQRTGRFLAISWTDWCEHGMWRDAQERLRETYRIGSGTGEAMPEILNAISSAEGRSALLRALALDAEHVVVCAQPLGTLLERHGRFSAADHAAFVESRGLTRRREPSSDETQPTETTLAPTGLPAESLEDRLAALWRDLLGVDYVGLDDDFFDLGGDSLLGIRVLNRLRTEHGVSDTLAGLMTAPTVRGLAARVRQLSHEAPAAEPDFQEIRL